MKLTGFHWIWILEPQVPNNLILWWWHRSQSSGSAKLRPHTSFILSLSSFYCMPVAYQTSWQLWWPSPHLGFYSSVWASLVAQRVKRLPAMQETWVQYLGQEDPLEKETATHSSTLAWKIPWTEKPGGLQSMEFQRVGHDWATSLTMVVLRWFSPASAGYKRLEFSPWVRKIPWKRKWQPIPVFLPAEFHGQTSLAGYSP